MTLILCLVLSPSVDAVTGAVPGPGRDMPRYFSGTACIAEGVAQSEADSKISSARLILSNGLQSETVWELVPPPRDISR